MDISLLCGGSDGDTDGGPIEVFLPGMSREESENGRRCSCRMRASRRQGYGKAEGIVVGDGGRGGGDDTRQSVA